MSTVLGVEPTERERGEDAAEGDGPDEDRLLILRVRNEGRRLKNWEVHDDLEEMYSCDRN